MIILVCYWQLLFAAGFFFFKVAPKRMFSPGFASLGYISWWKAWFSKVFLFCMTFTFEMFFLRLENMDSQLSSFEHGC